MQKILLTRREVAASIGISVASVEALTRSGQLPTVKVGRSVRVHIEALNEFAKVGTADKTVAGKPLDPIWIRKK